MIGQSNMAGRGFAHDVKPIYDEHIKVLVNGKWQTMTEPINYDRPVSGISLAASFAGAWRLKNPDSQIGLIPCADGGSSLDDWAVGGQLFDHALFQAKLALRNSSLDGILWHQGENDSFAGRSAHYVDKLTEIIHAFRKELKATQAPFITGGLGDYLSTGRYGKYFTEYQNVNQALLKLSEQNANTYYVTASGLGANPDGLHFDAMSLRKFGIRYFECYYRQKNMLFPLDHEQELIDRIQDRPLTKAEKIAQLDIKFAKGELALNEYELQLNLLNTQ